MYLNDLTIHANARLRKANKFLENEYGMKIDENTSLQDLYSLKTDIKNSIYQLKLTENNLHLNPIYSRNIMMMEAVNSLIENAEENCDKKTLNVIGCLAEFLGRSYAQNNYIDLNEAVSLIQSESVNKDFVFAILHECMNDIVESENDPWAVYGPADDEARKLAAKKLSKMKREPGDKRTIYQTDQNVQKRELEKAKKLLGDKNRVKGSRLGSFVTKMFKKGAEKPNKGNVNENMKNMYVRRLRLLMENEVEQAEVLIAIKGFAQELQSMVEKIGRLQNEDLGPVIDQMRETFGNEKADKLNSKMEHMLQEILNRLKKSQSEINSAVNNIADGIMTYDDSGGMDANFNDIGDDDADLGDNDLGFDDDFGGADAAAGKEGEPLGRAKKESVETLKKRIVEAQNGGKELDHDERLHVLQAVENILDVAATQTPSERMFQESIYKAMNLLKSLVGENSGDAITLLRKTLKNRSNPLQSLQRARDAISSEVPESIDLRKIKLRSEINEAKNLLSKTKNKVQKSDFLDVDKDKDRGESMDRALRDKKSKKAKKAQSKIK